jgi:protoporphyrinogen oxidase
MTRRRPTLEDRHLPASRTAVIIGAGPAGLTAAWEFLKRTDVRPIVLEMNNDLGGISRTVVHGGNRIDIGGHRFFSKVDRVMDWWQDMLPTQRLAEGSVALTYQRGTRELHGAAGPDPELEDAVMLVRSRRSRIYHLGKFFDYPVSLTPDTLLKLGARRTARIGLSYARAAVMPRSERSLEDFLINRFGQALYRTFFKDYTEKVWGVPCAEISAEWGAQRIKGLNLRKAAEHFFTHLLPGSASDVAQKSTETSLIEQFLYPKFGPGQMWETTAARVEKAGGEVRTGWRVVEIQAEGRKATAVVAEDRDGNRELFHADFVISTMPMKELVRALAPSRPAPPEVRAVSEGLIYRDFVTVGILADDLMLRDTVNRKQVPIRDNWIYVQEPGVRVGRMQIYNNWSPWMVADRRQTWIGLEYFCNEGDELWSRTDGDLMRLAAEESERIGILDRRVVRDQCVIRVPKTYPAYFGAYAQFGVLRAWVDELDNLFLIGRNGMHRYNNQDHSMLTAMTVVDQIALGVVDKAAIWSVNTDPDYHEEKD